MSCIVRVGKAVARVKPSLPWLEPRAGGAPRRYAASVTVAGAFLRVGLPLKSGCSQRI